MLAAEFIFLTFLAASFLTGVYCWLQLFYHAWLGLKSLASKIGVQIGF